MSKDMKWNIPPILTGQKNEEEWKKRRKELLWMFGEYVYGHTPEIQFDSVKHYRLNRLELKNGIICEMYRIFFVRGNLQCSLRFEIYFRELYAPMPACVLLDVYDESMFLLEEIQSMEHIYRMLPYELIVEAGYAAVCVHANDVCPDHPDKYTRGIMEFAQRKEETGWGAIGAWAWAGSRVADFLCEDARFDSERLMVTGLSRAGKTALWCGAQDERFAAVISCESGCTGSSLLRGKKGEHIRDMVSRFPFWTCDKYASFAEREEELPVDQHMLLALCAPRLLYVSDAIEDEWADPWRSYDAVLFTGEVYRLLGKDGLHTTEFPPVNTPLVQGNVGYHVRTGIHAMFVYDWIQYLNFLKPHFG